MYNIWGHSIGDWRGGQKWLLLVPLSSTRGEWLPNMGDVENLFPLPFLNRPRGFGFKPRLQQKTFWLKDWYAAHDGTILKLKLTFLSLLPSCSWILKQVVSHALLPIILFCPVPTCQAWVNFLFQACFVFSHNASNIPNSPIHDGARQRRAT